MNPKHQLTIDDPAQANPLGGEVASWGQPSRITTRELLDLSAPSHLRSSPRTYLEPLVVHKRLIIKCLIVSLVIGWLAIVLWPRKYASEAKLWIRVGRESVSLDPTATTSETLMLQKTQEEEVNSALDVMSSRYIAEKVVEELGATAIIDGSLPGKVHEKSRLRTTFAKVKNSVDTVLHHTLLMSGVRDNLSDHELAVMKMQKSLDIYAPKKSTVVTVSAKSKTPKMAQAIAGAVVNRYLEEHLKASKTEGSQQFFAQQAEDAEKKLSGLLNRRSEMMQRRNIASVESKRVALTARLSTIETDILNARGSLEQASAEIEDLSNKIEAAKDEIVAAKQEQSDETWSSMRNRLYELELQEVSLAAKYTDDHPRLVQLRKQLAEAKDILGVLQSERVNQNMTPNPTKLRLQEQMQGQQTKAAGLRSVLAEKENQYAATEQEIRELLEYELDLEQVDREILVAQNSLTMLREKQEEARVIDELQSKRITNVSVVQPASFVERAVQPKKKVLGAAFLMLGLLGGVSLAFLRESSTEMLRTPAHVETGLLCPVIATIEDNQKLSPVRRLIRSSRGTEFRNACKSILLEVLATSASNTNNVMAGQTVGVLGVSDGCGASTLASGLAIASSEDVGLQTTLIDADARNGTISEAFDTNGAPGFVELLSGQAERNECVKSFKKQSLKLISCSAPGVKGRSQVDPQAAANVLAELRESNDVLIVDLPSANSPDPLFAVARLLDQVLIVVESERTDLGAARRLVQRLKCGHVNVAGIVLNKHQNHVPAWLENFFA